MRLIPQDVQDKLFEVVKLEKARAYRKGFQVGRASVKARKPGKPKLVRKRA